MRHERFEPFEFCSAGSLSPRPRGCVQADPFGSSGEEDAPKPVPKKAGAHVIVSYFEVHGYVWVGLNCNYLSKLGTLLDLCVSSLHRGHANPFCVVQFCRMIPERNSILLELRQADNPRKKPDETCN